MDDDAGERELILIALQEGGRLPCDIVAAEDGPKALDYLFGRGSYAGRDAGEAPALVLLDLHLPGMDGLDVLRHIRFDPRTRVQPVVMLSSSGEERDRRAAYELGVNAYVRKPVDFVEFGRAIRDLARFWLAVNLPPAVLAPASTAAGPARARA